MASIDYATVFHSTTGLGGFVSKDANDHAFAFDGSNSGRRDHIVFYNSGAGRVYVLRRGETGNFNAIYKSENQGIGGWDFSFSYDRALAFDYDSSGMMNYIVCYRPGAGGCFVLQHDGQGGFDAVFAQPATDKPGPDGGMGIGGYDLRWPWDHMLAFDLDRKKCNDALFIWAGMIGRSAVVKNVDGQFVAVHREWSTGFSDYPMMLEGDWAVAFDWTRTGFDDHILLFNVWYNKKPQCAVVTKQGNAFVTVWKSLTSISGWPGTVHADLGFVFDGEGKGSNCCFGIYHAGAARGHIWLMTSPKSDGNWTVVKKGSGIGGVDLKNAGDKVFAFDYEGKGAVDYLFVWRKKTGGIHILKRK